MTCGIYKLEFVGLSEVYVGQSVNIEQRYKDHLNELKANRSNILMIKAYELFGAPSILVLEECVENLLNDAEIFWIMELNSFNNGLNLTRGGNSSGSGITSIACKYSETQIIEAFLLLIDPKLLSYSEISNKTGISYNSIVSLSNGNTHENWLKYAYPKEYEELLVINKCRKLKGHCTIGNKSNAKSQGIKYPILLSPDKLTEYDNIENISEFARCHNISRSGLSHLLNGDTDYSEGFTRKDYYARPTKTDRVFPKVVDPTGKEYEILTSLTQFAKLYGLDSSAISKLTLGKVKSHKGWKLA